MGWKYVMFETKIAGCSAMVPVVFPDKLVHKDVVEHMRHLLGRTFKGASCRPVSAGKIEHVIVDGLGGDSETLGLKAHEDDSKIIEAYSYFHGLNAER